VLRVRDLENLFGMSKRRTNKKMPLVYRGMRTPWGKADQVSFEVSFIGKVYTASHGGLKLDAKHNHKVPEYLRRKGGWYEEDCDWCIPFVIFEKEIQAEVGMDKWNKLVGDEALRTMKMWLWESYEKLFQITLAPGESRGRDKEMKERDSVV